MSHFSSFLVRGVASEGELTKGCAPGPPSVPVRASPRSFFRRHAHERRRLPTAALLPDLAVGELGALGLPCISQPLDRDALHAREDLRLLFLVVRLRDQFFLQQGLELR